VTFIGFVPRVVVELTPLSGVFLRIHVTLLFLLLGLDLLRLAFFSLSFVLQVKVSFSMISLWHIFKPEPSLTPVLEFLLNFDCISINNTHSGYFQEIHFYLDVPVHTTAILQNQVPLRVFDTKL
jgi:hypothetical protein